MTEGKLLYLDCESFSETPIKFGAHKYSEKAELLIATFAIDDGPVYAVDYTDPKEEETVQGFEDFLRSWEGTFVIHNSSFDRTIFKNVRNIDIPPERTFDTLACARTVGLPGALGTLCEIFKIPLDKAKDKKGHDLIRKFCIPQPKNTKLRRLTRETHPKEWKQFLEYARTDIEAMRALYHALPKRNYRDREFELWCLTSTINLRGFRIDTELAESAIKAVESASTGIDSATSEATNGQVGSATQRDVLLGYILKEYGVALPDMQASTLERRLSDPELPQSVKELLTQRLMISTTSTAKYQTLINCVSSDGRLRETLEFCGAARTGRDSGRLFQPQNLPSKNLLNQYDIDQGIEFIKAGCADLVFDNVMLLASSCIRGCIIASAGKKLVISDLANIEGRDTAWLAGEEWKLQAFRDYDAGTGEDLYRLAYAKAFNIDVSEVDGGASKGPNRNIGKVLELAMGFGGGCGAFLTFADIYEIKLDEMADAVWGNIPKRIKEEAEEMWRWAIERDKTFDLKQKTYIVCDSLKRMWRESHPAISSFWGELEDTVKLAFNKPGSWHICRKVKVRKVGSWLHITLPSGRTLCYAAPKLAYGKISYMGIHPYTKKWTRLSTFGGKLVENCLGANTEILTLYGWKPVVEISLEDKVWDGEFWVEHSGLISKGFKETINFGGVRITPDHKILVNACWKEAHKTNQHEASSSFEKNNRYPKSYVSGSGIYGKRWTQIYLENTLRLWKSYIYGIFRVFEKAPKILWMCEKGFDRRSYEKYSQQPDHKYPKRENAFVGGLSSLWNKIKYSSLPHRGRMAYKFTISPSVQREQVYDLMDCGPLHCFTIRGTDKRPFIVHNCAQSVARDIMMHNLPAIEAAGYANVLRVHDEVVCETPDTDDFTPEGLSNLLAHPPPWAADMPLAAKGFQDYRYRKD